jgi:lipid-binding SYLF domain-containing protein
MRIQATALLLAAIVASTSAPPALAARRPELERDARQALQSLTANNTAARLLGEKARAVLVFPNIVKAGFMFGGQIGDGVLLKNGKAAGFYNSVAASYGLQAGLQVFGYALFFMNDKALAYLDKSAGFEIGVGPSIVVVDAGIGKTLTSTRSRRTSMRSSSIRRG